MFNQTEIEFYRKNGFIVSKSPLFSEARFKELKALTEIIVNRDPAPGASVHVYELLKKIPDFLDFVIEDNVLNLVESLIGPNIGLLSSSAFIKLPNADAHFKWHTDFGSQIEYHEEISKIQTTAILIAVTPSTIASGCLQYIPGSHLKRTKRKYNPSPEKQPYKGEIYYGLHDDEVDLSKGVVNLELPEGYCSFHDLHVIHGSQPNKAQRDRILLNFWFFNTDLKELSVEAKSSLKKQNQSSIHLRGLDPFETCRYSIVGSGRA